MSSPKRGKKKKKKKRSKLEKLLRPVGFLIEDKAALKRARMNRPARYPWELFFVREPSRFEQEEGNFTAYDKGRPIKVHVVPAPWKRVILYSILYAFVVGVTKFFWFYTFGRPNWVMAVPDSPESQHIGIEP